MLFYVAFNYSQFTTSPIEAKTPTVRFESLDHLKALPRERERYKWRWENGGGDSFHNHYHLIETKEKHESMYY